MRGGVGPVAPTAAGVKDGATCCTRGRLSSRSMVEAATGGGRIMVGDVSSG